MVIIIFFGGSLKPSLLILDNLLILVFGDCGIYFYPQVCSKQVPNDRFLCFATESNRHSPPLSNLKRVPQWQPLPAYYSNEIIRTVRV